MISGCSQQFRIQVEEASDVEEAELEAAVAF
jgi:hypothetical protein